MAASIESIIDDRPLEDPAPSPVGDQRINLQVGERKFTTLASTLVDGSPFFASLLSSRWVNSQSADGSYFIDADPELFAHILRYLRRRLLPIMYDRIHGFDHAFYRALHKEAEYFGIDLLRKWIEEKGYLAAVKVRYSAQVLQGISALDEGYGCDVNANTEQWFYPAWGIEKVYECPRDIPRHNGDPSACGRACQRLKGDDGDTYVDQDFLRTVIITKRTEFT